MAGRCRGAVAWDWRWGTVSVQAPLPLLGSRCKRREACFPLGRKSGTHICGAAGGGTVLWLRAQASEAAARDFTTC